MKDNGNSTDIKAAFAPLAYGSLVITLFPVAIGLLTIIAWWTFFPFAHDPYIGRYAEHPGIIGIPIATITFLAVLLHTRVLVSDHNS